MIPRLNLLAVLSWQLVLAGMATPTFRWAGASAWGQEASESTTSRLVTRIAPGTRIELETLDVESGDSKWNRVVLLARPRIASGDVERLPESIRRSVQSFVLTILAAAVADESRADETGSYALQDVGVGYSTPIDSQLTIVTIEEAEQLKAKLSFFQRQMLAENESQLRTAKLVARTTTLTIFDTPAIMLRDGEHREYLIRHFVWIDRRSGRVSMLVWLLEEAVERPFKVADQALRWVPGKTREDRTIHVDGSEFTLGIPSERAFALETLPPGRDVSWKSETAELAAKARYSRDELQAFTEALTENLRSALTP